MSAVIEFDRYKRLISDLKYVLEQTTDQTMDPDAIEWYVNQILKCEGIEIDGMIGGSPLGTSHEVVSSNWEEGFDNKK